MDPYIKKILEENPHFSKLAQHTLIIPEEEYNVLFENPQEVALKMVENILSKNKYKEYITKLFKGNIEMLQISYPCYGDLCGSQRITRKNVIDYFKIARNNKNYTKEEQEYINRLKRLSGIDAFKTKIYNKIYKEEIDGTTFEISGKNIIELLTLDEEKYRHFITENKNKEKLYFIFYITYKVLLNEKVIDNYDFGSTINERIKRILSYQDLDFEALNQLSTPKEDDIDINIDKKLEEKILKDMPKNFTLIEQAIYIYIKMCTIFMYDEEYYAVNQRGPATLKHQSPEYISSINLDNNELVCFEFNAIYSYFLKKLNIYYETIRNASETYGLGHEYLLFRVGKFLIDVDAVTHVLFGDMTNAITHAPLTGLKCINDNNETKEEFKQITNKVYEVIQDEINYRSKFYQSVSDYKTLVQLYGENDPRITLEERIKIMIEYIETSNMQDMRAYTYLLFLKNRLFSKEEQENNIEIRLVKNEMPTNNLKVADVMAIIAINKENLRTESENNIYMTYKMNIGFKQATKEELVDLFTSHVDYIDRKDKIIPGLT